MLKRDPAVPLELPTVTGAALEDESGELFAYPQDDSFADLLNTFSVIIGIIFLIATIVALVLSIIEIKKKFGKKRKIGSDIVEFINPINYSKKSIRITRGKNLKEESESDLNLKLRKIFKRKVKKGFNNEKISLNELPLELTKKAITQDINEVKIITDIYEKARYSNEKVNLEEIEKLKSIKIKKPPKTKTHKY